MADRNPTIVVADDEPHIRMMMKVVLARGGFDVVGEASNGREAIEKCRLLRPDLVLLDINMPIQNGDEALAEILKDLPGIAAIMFTSVADSMTVERCIEMGAVNYLRKDAPVQQISEMVKQTWQEWRSRGGEP
ncbi:MAG TPA: response regulator transcription factor [Fibrobacteria bacterium]|nr:response regulator transcription factor [Fibrobacteria bacterium]